MQPAPYPRLGDSIVITASPGDVAANRAEEKPRRPRAQVNAGPAHSGNKQRRWFVIGETRLHIPHVLSSKERTVAAGICFVCERPFLDGQAPAETWAHGDHLVCVCRECVDHPPGGPPLCVDALPEVLRRPLLLHLRSLSLRARSRRFRHVARTTRALSNAVRDRMAWVRFTHRNRGKGEYSGEPPK